MLTAYIQNIDALDNDVVVSGYLIASGSYTTGGDTANLGAAVPAPGVVLATAAIPSSGPMFCPDAWSITGNLTNGYFAIPGTGLNLKVKMSASIGGSELAAGAYPASVTGDTIAFNVQFNKLN